MKGKRLLYLFYFLFTILQTGFGQLPVRYLGIDQGLSNNSVRCVYQDSKGFIWLGTNYGLNRYDGNEFRIFTNNLKDSSSLPHNYIYTIHEDTFSNLWVSTGLGLAIYNSIYNNFSPVYYFPYQSKTAERIGFGLNGINSDKEGNVFLGTDVGLLVKNTGEKNARQVPLQWGRDLTIRYSVRAITVAYGKTWLLISGWGLGVYDNKNNKIELISDEVKNGSCLAADKKGAIWIGAGEGLFKYAIASGQCIEFYKEGKDQPGPAQITSICIDKAGKVWTGTDGAGVSVFDPVQKSFVYLLPGEGKNKLSNGSVNSIIADKESRIWIGTLRGGCDIIDEEKSRFSTIAHVPFSANSLPGNFVYSFYEDQDHDLLIGTDGDGLSLWNRQASTFHNYKHISGDESSLSNNSVASIRQDSYGNTWLGTFGGGINKFNKATGTFKHYSCINDSTGTEDRFTWLVYEDKEKVLWVSTYGGGKLYRFNRNKDRFEAFRQDYANIVSLTEDSYGNFWAGDASRLIEIDKDKKSNDRYFEIGKPVRAIFEDRQHRLWLGTEGGGLILFDAKAGKTIRRFSEADGLCNNAVLNILEDSVGNLWLSTFNGLSKFDPGKKSFSNFYQSDGLQSNQFSYRAASELSSGEMVFGGINGFNIFYPQNINTRNYMPPVYITGISVNNKPVYGANRYILKEDNSKIQALKIPYNEAVLSFRFNALEYSSPDKISYSYYLQGWDKGWNNAGNNHTINYNNLREGDYTLRVRSTNAAGQWNTEEVTLKITVLPPWYRSWWAYLIYLSLAGALGYLYIRYRERQARLEYEVKLARINAEKEKEITEKKISFFTYIAHEFRTPLTLIINPVKDILKGTGEPGSGKKLSTVYRNARRLLSLVDQLLLFRKVETVDEQMKIEHFDIVEVCNEVYLSFSQHAVVKKIEFSFNRPDHKVDIYGDKQKVEIILFNLLSNAFKYTDNNGKIVIDIKESGSDVVIAVEDNGIGIPAETGKKLFESFYQAGNKDKTQNIGFGVGLHVSQKLAYAHKGDLTYTSREGQGSVFYLRLLKGKVHFADQQISEEYISGHEMLHELVEEPLEEVLTEEETVKNSSSGVIDNLISGMRSMLVVDDNADMRAYVRSIFSGSFNIYEAKDGDEGFELVVQEKPDIVISDVMMKNVNGVELCKRIKGSTSLAHIPVILLTASSSDEIRLQGIEGGAEDYITKPFNQEIIVARVQNILKSRSHLKEYFYNAITINPAIKIAGEHKEFIEHCIRIVDDHIDNPEFNISVFSREIGLSHPNLYKKVKSVSGLTVNVFIRYLRLRKAAEMLINTDKTIVEVTYLTGFNDVRYFREQFSKLFGMNPSDYVKRYRRVLTRTTRSGY